MVDRPIVHTMPMQSRTMSPSRVNDEAGGFCGISWARCGLSHEVCCEPEGAVTTTNWRYVGEGRGGYDVVKTYNYVGEGHGTHDAMSTGCDCSPGFRIALILFALVIIASAFCVAVILKFRNTETASNSVGSSMATSFAPYHGYLGPLNVTGIFTTSPVLYGDIVSLSLAWALQGTDPECVQQGHGPADALDACGIRITSGTDCTNTGSNLFGVSVPSDPWNGVTYTTQLGNSEADAVVVQTGLQAVFGHAVVIFDNDGTRIACGLLSQAEPQA